MKLQSIVLALIALAAIPATAGEYSVWSPGFQLEVAHGINTSPGHPQGLAPDYYPQALPITEQAGLGFVMMLRPAEMFNGALSNFQVPLTIGYRYGRGKDSRSQGTTTGLVNGTVTTLADSQANRKTTQQDIYFYVPVRFYPGGNGAVNGGLWVEAGPQFSSVRQSTDLTISGNSGGTITGGSDSFSQTVNRSSLVVGVGGSINHYTNQFSLGLHYQNCKSTDNAAANNMIRLTAQWIFN